MENIFKKTLSILFALCLSVVSALAQDIIVMRNSTEIKAKIRNIGQNEITYSKWSNQDGPTYTISKSDVRYIQYANGEKEVFENTRPTASYRGGNNSYSGSYSAANTGAYGNANTANSSVGSYSAGGGSQTLGIGVASGSYSSSLSSDNLSVATAVNTRPKGTGMYKTGKFLTIFGLIFSGAGLITAAITHGDDVSAALTASGLIPVLVGVPLWIGGASKMKKSTQTLTYVPVVERTWELGDLALVPSVGVTNDMISNQQSISAGLTLKF